MIFMWNKCLFHHLGIVSDKKWSLFLDLGVQSPIFWHLKTANLSDFGCKKLDFGRPNLKTETTFCHQLSPKNNGLDTYFTWKSFSGEFWAIFENLVIYAHFWTISHYKTPKSKTSGANGQYMSKNYENLYLGSSYIETIGFWRPTHKKRFFILRNTLMHWFKTLACMPRYILVTALLGFGFMGF